uniref:uncharacterized protein LOC122606534 n=1 Tax=Erigeron canadensis TaxID=72917 RepID=UPI001CB9BAD8|nr:uncharacterized protein LOC122606534 [Erigeron canadensis]
MGNNNSNGLGKVILPNGTIQEYTKPMTVAELMLDHPQQAVVEFDQTLTNGKRPKPLPADAKLETKKVYMMVPKRSGKPIGEISLEEARRILLKANVVLNTGSFGSAYTGFLPLFVRMCPAAVVKSKKKVKVEEKSQVVVKKSGLFREVDLESEVMESYFLSRQLSGKNAWKPSLDTIKEKGVTAKIRHWLL